MRKNGTKKNFAYNMIYQVFQMILPLITMPYVSRVLGAEGVGTYSYTYSIAHYFVLFGTMGCVNYGNRSVARVREDPQKRNAVFSEVYTLQLMIALTAILAYLLYVFLFAEYKLYAMLQSFYVIGVMFDINWLFFGMEDFKLTVTKKILIKVANVLCIFIFVKTADDLWKYVLVLSLGHFVAQSSMWLFAKRYIRFTFAGIRQALSHLKGFLILFIPIIATSIYRMMDKVMLGSMSSMEQVGFYESAEKLISICLCVISAFGAVMMPRMSNLLGKGKLEECKALFVRSMEIAIFIGCAIAFGVAAVADDFIPIFYGPGYEDSILITAMLSSTVLFITWACIVRTLYLIPAERNKVYIHSVFLGAAINVAVNILLIPRYAAAGAAVGTIAAEVSVALYQAVLVRNELELGKCFKKSIPFVIFGALMWLVVKAVPFSVNGNILYLLAEICIGAFFYLLCSGVYFVLTKNKLLFDLLNSFRKHT